MNVPSLQTFVCPTCGIERTGVRRRCYPCTKARHSAESKAKISAALLGHRAPEGLIRRMVEARFAQGRNFDIGATTRGKPAPHARAVGSKRVANGHYQVKCPDGKWRYEHRVVWAAANGPIASSVLIHHINHDPFDNRLENLQPLNRRDHARHHTAERGAEMQVATVAKRNARKAAGGTY